MQVRSFGRGLLITVVALVVSGVITSMVLAQNKDQAGAGDLEQLKAAFLKFKDSIVTIEEHLSTVSMTAPPVGGVVAYAGPVDEEHPLKGGWMVCDGRPVSKVDYPELFAAIGTTYGQGTDSGGAKVAQRDFNLPNYEGYFLRGVDTAKSLDKGPRSAGGLVGSREDFASALPTKPFTTDLQGQHTHPLNFETSASRNVNNATTRNTVANPSVGGPLPSTAPAGQHQHTVTGGGDQETRPINLSVNWIIRVK